jgi:heavy metal efflux system protein
MPAALSNGIGSQVQEPLTPVVGGILPAPVLILIILPLLIDLFSLRVPVVQEETEGAEPAE